MATRFYYSMRYPPQWPLSPAHVSTSWDAGTWSYEDGVWVHIPRILTYGDFGRITTAKIPFGPDDPEHNQYNQREIYAQQGPNFAQGWYPCPNGPTCDPPFKVYAAQFFSDPLRAQTINGNVLGQMLCTECFEDREGWWPLCGAASDSCRSIVIRVFSGDFAVERGVLLEHFPAELVSEFIEGSWEWDDETQQNGSYKPKQNRNFPPSSAITEVVCEDGDIIVVEIGFKTFGDLDPGLTEWLNHQVQFSFYHNSETDLPVDETTTTELDAWLELDADIVFQHPAKPFALSNYMVTEGVGYCKYRSYVGFCETEIRAPGIYGQPVVGVDEKSGYGIVDLPFLDGDAPLYMIPIFPLNINPEAVSIEPYAPSVSDAYAANGCFQITGAGVLGETVPPISEYAASGAFILGGSGVLGAPPRTDFRAAGQFELSGTCRMTSTSPYPLVTQYEAGGSLALFGPCSLESVLAQVDAFMAAGCYSLSGRSALSVIMPSLRVDAYVAAGCYELHGPCSTVRGPVYAYAADTKTGPCLEITSRARVGFIFPQITAMAAQGGYVLESPDVPDDGVFETLVLTGARSEVSVYSNFKFNSYAKYGGKYYGATQDGIFLLEGDDDAGIQIHTGAKIGPTNFGTDREKRLRPVKCGGDCGEALVRVSDDNGKTALSE